MKHYGFQSGGGCVPCDCAEASDSSQCDDVTGQCRCKPGVSGRSCNRCSAGFWNYTVDGCVCKFFILVLIQLYWKNLACGCKSEYSLGFGCNALTGQCECLQGVIGEKCNQCPHRWVFVPDYGCHQCDSCTHALLDSTDELRHMIDPVIIEFDVSLFFVFYFWLTLILVCKFRILYPTQTWQHERSFERAEAEIWRCWSETKFRCLYWRVTSSRTGLKKFEPKSNLGYCWGLCNNNVF